MKRTIVKIGQALAVISAFGFLTATVAQAADGDMTPHQKMGHHHPAVVVHRHHHPHPLMKRHHHHPMHPAPMQPAQPAQPAQPHY